MPHALPSLDHIEAAIADLDRRIAACDEEIGRLGNEIGATPCHPHHHWWTAGALAVTCGLRSGDIAAVAGLLALPWRDFCTQLDQAGGAAFLMERWPAVVAADRPHLEEAGMAVLRDRGLVVGDRLPPRWLKEPKFGCGAPFVAFSFEAKNRDAWSGLWTLPVTELQQELAGMARGDLFQAAGMVLAMLVEYDPAALAERGARSTFLRAQAAYRADCARFAAWQETLERHVDRDLFAGLCRTLGASLKDAPDAASALGIALTHIRRWKHFLSGRGSHLSPEEMRGLFAELQFLSELIGRQGAAVAVDAWLGPERSHQDFIFGNGRHVSPTCWTTRSGPD